MNQVEGESSLTLLPRSAYIRRKIGDVYSLHKHAVKTTDS